MDHALFVGALGILAAALLAWGFRVLPGERWQVIASIPTQKHPRGRWSGINVTWYGFISAAAATAALALFLALAGSVGAERGPLLGVLLVVLAVAAPAARLVAFVVEQKRATLTVAGAVFCGLVVAPAALATAGHLARESGRTDPFPELAVFAALGVAYALGEGLGRLACISFGCCYGRALRDLPPHLARPLERLAFTFHGECKKISYASGLAGVKVVPVQAMTAALYVATALAGTWLFLEGRFLAALALSTLVTQLWRFASEALRADYRGARRFSVYQLMALGGAAWVLLTASLLEAGAPAVDLRAGLISLWDPGVGVALELLFVAIFLYTGVSKVTGSELSFHVRRHRV